jgi:serine/threonine protein kinase
MSLSRKPASSVLEEEEERQILIRDREPSAAWNIAEQIGEGAFAKVHKCSKKATNSPAAVKIFSNCTEEDDLKDILNEIDILSNCQHENIVRFYEAYTLADKIWVRFDLYKLIDKSLLF